ncbi:hypothetical protein [Streptomyces tricolor]
MTDHFEPRDPEAEERERDIQRDTHIAARTANPGAMDPAPHPARRVRHSGPDTKFCVLCLSGEHERVDEAQQPAAPDGN